MLQNAEAEQSIIGLALSDYSCAERLSQIPEDAFTAIDHVTLHRAIRKLISRRERPDMIAVNNLLTPADKGAAALMIKCIGLGVSPVMYDQYERIVLDLRRRRRMQAACMKITQRAGDPGEDIDAMAAELQAEISDNPGQTETVSMNENMLSLADSLGKKPDFISTGIGGFDRLNGGFRPGQLIYLGARPSVGKSALAMSIVMHVARKSGPVLMVSLEMPAEEIGERMLSRESGMDLGKIVAHSISDEEWPALWNHMNDLSKLPIQFSAAKTPFRIKQEATTMIHKSGLKLIVIDYVGLLRGGEKYKSRYEEITDVSRQLKLMTMELKIPVLALTQFNRNPEHGGGKPSMADARDSGALEQDANVFLTQYAPKDLEPGDDLFPYWQSCRERGTEFQVLNCEKYRQGKTGAIFLEFDKPHMRFTSIVKG